MKKISTYEWIVLVLCIGFLLFCALWLTGHHTPSLDWQVQTERFDTPPTAADPTDGYPDSLLEGEVINLNTASRSDLLRLPNIGSVRADAILAYRNQNGPFLSVDALLSVPGIGPVTLNGMRAFIMVE